MARFVVAGLINIETTVRIDGFPLAYAPARYLFHGIRSTVSGVGLNISKALHTLGHDVRFLSLIGQDVGGESVRAALRSLGIDDRDVLGELAETAQSVILYDADGQRAIHVDLKDVQERVYPEERAAQAFDDADMAVLCNINFSRPMLESAAHHGLPIATDVHAIGDLEDAYNSDYMAAADVLFQSHENLPNGAEAWLRALAQRYDPQVAVVGLGEDGALLYERGASALAHVPAVHTRPVVNTIGAGDALFSAFLHDYVDSGDAHAALRQAVVFASYKVGAAGAADGFLTAPALHDLAAQIDAGE